MNDHRHDTGLKPQVMADLKGLALYLGLSYAISWIFFIPAANAGDDGLEYILIILGAFGPLLAALLSIRFTAGKTALRDWLKSLFNFRMPAWLYLLGAFLLPLAIGAGHYLLYTALGGTGSFAGTPPWWSYLLYLVPTALFSGGNEEPGWRGFALPVLLKFCHPLAAALALGFFHAAWHLPLMGHYGTSFGWYLFDLIPLTVILNWFYLISRRSILPVMLLHAATNVIGEFLPTPLAVLGGAGDFMLLRGIVYWIMAVVILIGTRGRLGHHVLENAERQDIYPREKVVSAG